MSAPTPEPRCERRTASAGNAQNYAILTRCTGVAAHTINLTLPPAVGGQKHLVFPVQVCDGCVQQLTGWH